MAKTKREILMEYVDEFKCKVHEIVDLNKLFPDLNNYRIEEIVLWFRMLLLKQQKHVDTIAELLAQNKISLDTIQFENLLSAFSLFVEKFHKVLKLSNILN